MRKKVLMWLMALSLMLPPATVNAAGIADDNEPSVEETKDTESEPDKGIYTLSHAGIFQEGQFPEEGAAKAGEPEEAVDLEGVKSFIIEELEAGRGEIDISGYEVPVLYIDRIISEVLNENPKFFYVSFNECSIQGDAVTVLTPDYDSELVQAEAEYEAAVAKALSVVDSSMNDTEKAVVLHDYLVTHCEYDLSYQRHTAYDALVTGSAVCQGYALAYGDLMKRAGISCAYVVSDEMNHMWNMVSVDGSWYHVDATWDDPIGQYIQSYCGHKHLLVSDSRLTELEHKNWYLYGGGGAAEASSTRFDNAAWTEVKSIIARCDGAWYYMGSAGGSNGLVRREGSLESGSSSISHPIYQKWYVWESPNSFWTGLYSYMVRHNDELYFNTSDKVYVYKNGAVKECYTYTGGQGYLYDVIEADGRLYCGVAKSPTDNVSYVEILTFSDIPTPIPTTAPTSKPTAAPTSAPTSKPTAAPTSAPTSKPTAAPTSVPTAPPVSGDFPFKDVAVNPGNWKYDSVKFVYENDIMNGITNKDGTVDSFDPDSSLTRGMFATVLYRMAGNPAITFEERFSDVAPGIYYSDPVIWAYQKEIVNGYGDGRFGVFEPITREQIAKMLMVYADLREYDTSVRGDLDSFPDTLRVSGWATEYMQWAVGSGMINGQKAPDGTSFLNPGGNATRAECATMLMRFIQKYGR